MANLESAVEWREHAHACVLASIANKFVARLYSTGFKLRLTIQFSFDFGLASAACLMVCALKRCTTFFFLLKQEERPLFFFYHFFSISFGVVRAQAITLLFVSQRICVSADTTRSFVHSFRRFSFITYFSRSPKQCTVPSVPMYLSALSPFKYT